VVVVRKLLNLIRRNLTFVLSAVMVKCIRRSNVVLENLIPTLRNSPIVSNAERIFQSTTDFIRGNPIVSTASIGAGITGIVAVATAVRRRKKRKSTKKRAKKRRTSKKRKPRKRKKKTKAQIRRMRLRNLAKARRAKKRGKRKIIRGRGLGSREIKHSGRGTKGKFKIVSFRDKRTGKMVRFKAKR